MESYRYELVGLGVMAIKGYLGGSLLPADILSAHSTAPADSAELIWGIPVV